MVRALDLLLLDEAYDLGDLVVAVFSDLLLIVLASSAFGCRCVSC